MTLNPKNHEQVQRLRDHLDTFLETFDYLHHRDNDPVSLLWTYENAEDQALMGLLASGVAYGRVALVRDAGKRLAHHLGPNPSHTLKTTDIDTLAGRFDGFVYRMTRGPDVVDLLSGCKQLYERYETLEDAFLDGDGDFVEQIAAFVDKIRQGRHRKTLERGFRYLLPTPADGGACKRLHLYLRWMIRPTDAIDLGIWTKADPSQLRMPLDTHTARICRYLGLSDRKTVDAKMVEQVSQSLRLLDPEDPLKYDFPICHLGISGGCIHKRSEEHCPQCPLEPLCVIGRPQ